MLEDQINALEQRIAQLEEKLSQLAPANHAGMTLRAPFRVVDPDGVLVLDVQRTRHDTSLRLFTHAGQLAASIGVDVTGGYVTIRNTAGVLLGYFNVESAGARLLLNDHDEAGGVAIFGGDNGDDTGGGINIIQKQTHGGISLWATAEGGEFVLDHASGATVVHLCATQTGGSMRITDTENMVMLAVPEDEHQH